jgi:drug/metabolite transporter (DMT)-like permease
VRLRLSADALLVVCVTIWGLNFTVIKEALGNGFEPLSFASTRFTLATVAFVGVSLVRRERLQVQRRDLAIMAAWSGLIALNQVGFAYSFHLATASTIALVFGTLPIFAGIYSQLAGIDRLSRRRWLAAALSFSGVAMVAVGVHGTPSGHVGGILISLVAPATFALYSIGLTPFVHRYGTYTVNLLVAAFALPPLLAVSAPQLASTDWGAVSSLGWLCLVYSALVAYTFTNLLWFVAIKYVGTARAAVYANLQPFIGAVFAVLILSETMTTLEWLGGAAIAVGIVLSRTGSASWKHVALETETAPHE